MIKMDGHQLVYWEEPLPLWLRAFTIFLGGTLVIAFPATIIAAGGLSPFTFGLLIVAVCVAAAMALGCFFIFIGFVSATELTIDPVAKTVVRGLYGPIINRTDRFVLSEIELPVVYIRKSQEEDDQPILRLVLPRGRVEMACFANKAEADAWAERIKQLLRS